MMITRFTLGAAAAASITTLASAGVTMTAEEVGNDVVFSGGGTLDISLWRFFDNANVGPVVSTIAVITAQTGGDDFDVYFEPVNFAGPASFPANGEFLADIGVGDPFGIQLDPFPLLGVPAGYTSGDPLDGAMTFENHTFGSMGLIEGEYTWTWDTADGQGDFFTVIVVPAPGALAALGVAGLVSRRRRRGWRPNKTGRWTAGSQAGRESCLS